MGFAENLKNIRKKKKITQKELARQLGVSFRTIQSYESGLVLPKSKKRYDQICAALDVTIGDLMQDETDVPFVQADVASQTEDSPYQLVSKISSLFAGNRLPDEDKDAVMSAIVEAYEKYKRQK